MNILRGFLLRLIDRFHAFRGTTRVILTTAAIAALLMIFGSASVQAGVVQWTSSGPYGGLVSVLAVDPHTPTNLYAAGFSGVFKSTNGGTSWARASNGITDPTVDTLVIDPVTPTTLYAGSVHGGPIVKSTDGAATWTPLSITLVAALAIDPSATSTLYASQQQSGLHKSTDGGATWTTLHVSGAPTFPTFEALIVDPQTPTTIYAGEHTSGIYKSLDGGTTWAAANTGFTGPIIQILALAIDPQMPATLYASAYTSGTSGLFKSTDGGTHWTLILNDIHSTIFFQTIAVDPQTPSTVYVGTYSAGVKRSTNGGASFTTINTGLPQIGVNVIAIDPANTSTLFTGTQNGVFATTNAGSAWAAASNGLALTTVNAVAVDPRTPATIYAGTTFSGIVKSTDNGGSWSTIYTGIGTTGNLACSVPDISSLAIDPGTPTTLYAGTQCTQESSVLKSTDGGVHWTAAASGLPFYFSVAALAIDPQATSTLFAASAGTGLFRSSDGGASWSEVTGVPTTDQATGVSIAAVSGNPSTVSVSTSGDGIYVSTDGGNTFQQGVPILPPAQAARPSGTLTNLEACAGALAFNYIYLGDGPAAPTSKIYALCLTLDLFNNTRYVGFAIAFAGFVQPNVVPLKGDDIATTFNPVAAPWAPPDGSNAEAAACMPVTFILGNPLDPTGFYVGAACGVLSGTNAGQQLVTMNTGLPPNLQINSLAITPAGSTLYAGAASGGVHQFTVDEIFSNGFE